MPKLNALATKVKKGTQYAKTVTKATKQGVKTVEKGQKGYQQVQSDLAGKPTPQKTVTENRLNEEIQEIRRYISLI